MVVTATGDVISAGWDDKLRFADLGSKAYHSEVRYPHMKIQRRLASLREDAFTCFICVHLSLC